MAVKFSSASIVEHDRVRVSRKQADVTSVAKFGIIGRVTGDYMIGADRVSKTCVCKGSVSSKDAGSRNGVSGKIGMVKNTGMQGQAEVVFD